MGDALDGGVIAVTPEYHVGGSMIVQGLSTDPLTLTPTRTRPDSATLRAPPYVGRVVTVTGTGDPEGMPAFRISAPAPSMISLRSPIVEQVAVAGHSVPVSAIRASRTAALEFIWTGGGDDPVFITLVGRGSQPLRPGPWVALRCTFAGAAGRAALSPEQLRTVQDFPDIVITVETSGARAIAVGSNVARLILTHYAANVSLVLQ